MKVHLLSKGTAFRKTAFIVLLLLVFSPMLAVASSFKNLTVGVVDTQRVFRESAPALKAEKELEKEFAPRDRALQKLAKQAKGLQSELEAHGTNMSVADRNSREQELAALSEQFERQQRQFREDLNMRRGEELARLQDQVKHAILKVAQKNKLDLVLYEGVFYANPKIDITNQVIAALASK
ncbi:MAG: OmpH family outer membrane protein [Proteobacteria bacterium]|nr:OmpH family outer membrane protein [Pseudomonadota bacterium]MDE3208727.1 OmpH family outer membrane protein [Pseudomonadota bacterium]